METIPGQIINVPVYMIVDQIGKLSRTYVFPDTIDGRAMFKEVANRKLAAEEE